MKEAKPVWSPIVVWLGTLNGTPIKGLQTHVRRAARLVQVSESSYILEMAFKDDAMGDPVWEEVTIEQSRS